MTAAALHREQALKLARLAQAACALLLLAAVAVAGLGLPGRERTGGAELPASRAESAAPISSPPPVSEGVDFSGIAQRLALIDNAPKAAVVDETQTPGTETEPPPAADTGVKFIGSIIEPTRRAALLSVNGRQRALVPGQKIRFGADPSAGELLLVSVEEDRVVVEDKSGRRTIEKSARSGSAITTVAESAPPPPAPEANSQPGVDPSVRALRDAVRGMDPERRRQAIQEFQRARAARDRNQGNE